MFLFTNHEVFGTYLHTGDCRFCGKALDDLRDLRDELGDQKLDVLHLDCTFANYRVRATPSCLEPVHCYFCRSLPVVAQSWCNRIEIWALMVSPCHEAQNM